MAWAARIRSSLFHEIQTLPSANLAGSAHGESADTLTECGDKLNSPLRNQQVPTLVSRPLIIGRNDARHGGPPRISSSTSKFPTNVRSHADQLSIHEVDCTSRNIRFHWSCPTTCIVRQQRPLSHECISRRSLSVTAMPQVP